MSEETIFQGYTRRELDREYDNRAKVADSAVHIAWFAEQSARARDSLGGVLDVAYGPTAEETLDIFGAASAMPVNVFFHGGYWRAMHKDDFSCVARAFVPAGAMSVIVNYALIPGVDMATLVDQCRRALTWLYHHVGEYGGDPGRLYVSGHSAGGHLAAMMMATDWPAVDAACPAGIVRGGLAVSGLFDLQPISLCFLNEDLHLDAVAVADYSPVKLDKLNDGSLILAYGGEEGDEYARQSRTLAQAWPDTIARGLDGHDHFSIMRELDTPDGTLSRMALQMMNVS